MRADNGENGKKRYLLDLPFQEVDSYRFLVILRESAFAISLDHARFAHSTIAHDHHLCREVLMGKKAGKICMGRD